MKTIAWYAFAINVTLGLCSVAVAVLRDVKPEVCYIPSEDTAFCKKVGDGEFEGGCNELVCAGKTQAIERNQFPITRKAASEGVTKDSYEDCWRAIGCKDDPDSGKCVVDPDFATPEWMKADKIVVDEDKVCPKPDIEVTGPEVFVP